VEDAVKIVNSTIDPGRGGWHRAPQATAPSRAPVRNADVLDHLATD
jgi:hypothetical protein